MSERPDLTKRRTIVPAPDEGIDPIDPHKPSPLPEPQKPIEEPAAEQEPAEKPRVELPVKDLNLQVTVEVMETIDFAKFKTKLTKREIVQRAVLDYWSQYRPTEL